MLNPQIVGKWDANHVWLQWSPPAEREYALCLRYLRPGKQEFTDWIETHTPWPLRDTVYLKIPTHAQGTRVQAQLALWTGDRATLQWEIAQAAEFLHCEAEFEFESDRKVTFAAGDIFTAMVDADVAAYALIEGLDVFPDTPARAKMRATQASGLFQLDYPAHFVLRPRPGMLVRNLAPSVNDLQPVEGNAVTIEGRGMSGPLTIALGKVNTPRQ